MRLTRSLVMDIEEALIRVAKKHKAMLEKEPSTPDDLLANEVEFTFTLREMTDKEIIQCG